MDQYNTTLTTPPQKDQRILTTPDRPSPQPFWLFAGVTDSDSDPGKLSKFHILENDARFAEEEPELTEIQHSLAGYEEFREMMKPGLAAVSLKITDLNPKTPLFSEFQLSGFRLGQDIIITCAHFTKWPDTWNNFEEMAQQYYSTKGGIFEARQEREILQGRLQHNTFNLQLVALHLPWDLAVFRVVTKPDGDDANQVISKDQIMFVNQGNRAKLDSYKNWWSVGYNSLVHEDSYNDFWSRSFRRQSPKSRNKITQNYSYYEANPPPMKSFLKPSKRTVGFGKIKENAKPGLRQEESSTFINLSAWHGRSGAMVCTQVNNVVYVCGVISGGDPNKNYNDMCLFTDEMNDWFTAAVWELRDDLDTNRNEFIKRFVMSI